MLPVQPQSDFASGKPLSLCGALTIQPLLIFGSPAGEGQLLHPPTSCWGGEVLSLEANFAASSPAEPGKGSPSQGAFFQTVMISSDPKSNFLVRVLSQQHPAKPKSGVWWDSSRCVHHPSHAPGSCSGFGNSAGMPGQCSALLSIPRLSQSLIPAQPAHPSQQKLPRHRPALLLLQGFFGF